MIASITIPPSVTTPLIVVPHNQPVEVLPLRDRCASCCFIVFCSMAALGAAATIVGASALGTGVHRTASAVLLCVGYVLMRGAWHITGRIDRELMGIGWRAA